MRFETVHPNAFGAADWARWDALRVGHPGLQSPYFAARWAEIVGRARRDARIVVVNGGESFFAAQRLSNFTAMPLGAPLADYQGVVGQAEISGVDLCRALKVGRIDFTHAPAGQAAFAAGRRGQAGSWIAELAGGAAAYRDALKARRAETVRQWDKKLRKLTKDHGEISFQPLSKDAAHFAAAMAWKNAQMLRTGQPPIWETPWVQSVLDECFAADDPLFGGGLFTLSCGERLIAAYFCLRGSGVLHAWVIAHDAAFDAYSPGVLLGRMMVEWAADNGIAEVDFGVGDYQFKRQLANAQRPLGWGFAARPSIAGLVRAAAYGARGLAERLPHQRIAALPGKAMRRLDVLRSLSPA
ncbi:MAG: GNAT family N-acetyltransferase [Hyphomonadaceae bacterium]